MSPVALQRVVVRMLYDAAFAEQIYSDAPMPELSERDRALLRAAPPGAFRTDPYRRARSLTALLDEYPASAALTGLPPLDAFFSSPSFHRAIQGRMSLAITFGAYLEPLAGPVARLERSIASARRARAPLPGPSPALATAPGLVPLTAPGNTLETYQILRERLGPEPARTLTERPPRIDGLPPLMGVQHLLIERGANGEIGVGSCDEGLAGLLSAAMGGRTEEALLAVAVRLGAEPHEAPDLLAGLVQDGLLVRIAARA